MSFLCPSHNSFRQNFPEVFCKDEVHKLISQDAPLKLTTKKIPSGSSSRGGSSSTGGAGGSNFLTMLHMSITLVINPNFPPGSASS